MKSPSPEIKSLDNLAMRRAMPEGELQNHIAWWFRKFVNITDYIDHNYISVISIMQGTYSKCHWWFWQCLFNANSMQFIKLITPDPPGGECRSHHEMIQFICGWGRVQIATESGLLDAFLHVWSVVSLLRMPNQLLQGFLQWFTHLKQGWYVRLLVWWLWGRDINHWCIRWMMKATVIRLIWSWNHYYRPSKHCPRGSTPASADTVAR